MTEFAIEREAKLFEAGEYPDKEITVSEAELDAIIAKHTDPIPIKVEHGDSVFDGALGAVQSMWRKGKELFGKISFPDAAWELIKGLDVRALSVGIARDKGSIAEVSLVRAPRIADARVFSTDCVGFSTAIELNEADKPQITQEVNTMSDEVTKTEEPKVDMTDAQALEITSNFKVADRDGIASAAQQITDFAKATRAELVRVATEAQDAIRELQRFNCDRTVDELKRAGKLVPASEEFARAILSQRPLSGSTATEGLVTFGEQKMHFADAFVQFLEAQPPCVNFRELVKGQGEATPLSPEAQRLWKEFGVNPESETAKKVISEMRR